ncbi:hypothetical protein Tsubulata_015049 [Turnera subulata]|uniref:Uncharacterized protein n=1 Tax=Turnera subulata TaxID=218843 RepID=A0A9Q0JL87_9ROSI|nr:hypothetical protein Tsubulata_015049 [Turnera subulata]
MEEGSRRGGGEVGGGSRQWDLRESFNLAIRSLLTSCSNQEFTKAFSRFSKAEQASLHRLFIQVITSLHKMVEEEFESLCLETQVGTALDVVEQLVEEESLDALASQKTNVMDAARNVSMAKENEIAFLAQMLERAEKQNQLFRDRMELLKKGKSDVSGMAVAVEKLRSGIVEYGS